MASPKVSYQITSQDQTQPGLKSAESGLSKFSAGAKATFKGLAIAAGAVIGAGAALGAVAMKLVSAYGEAQKASIRLAVAAKNNPMMNGDSVRSLESFASAMQRTSMFEDDQIKGLMAIGASMGYTEEQIKKVTQAAIDLASGTDIPIESAFDQLYKTLQGIPGRMSDSVAGLKSLTEEELKAGKAIEIINQQYAGMGAAMTKGVVGVKAQFKNMVGDLQEGLGAGLAPAFMAIMSKIKPILDNITKWVSDHSKQIANFFLKLPDIAVAAWGGVMTAMKNIFTIDFAVKLITGLFNFIVEGAKALFPLLLSATIRVWKSIFIVAKDAALSIWEVIKRVGQTIWTPISIGFEWAVYGIKVAWRETMKFFASLIDWIVENPINFFGETFHNIINGIKSAFEVVVNAMIAGLNEVVKPLDWILFQIKNIGKHGVKFGEYEKYEEGAGGIAKIKPIELDQKEWKKLQSNLAEKWNYNLSPPDRKIGEEVAAIWEDLLPAMAAPWANFVEELNEVWGGFGDDLKKAGATAWEAIKELATVVAEPWKEGIDQAKAKIIALLNSDLPPEIQALLVAALDKATSLVSSAPIQRDEMPSTSGGPKNSWDWFVLRLNFVTKSISEGLSKFGSTLWTGIKGFGVKIAEGAKSLWYNITHPGEALKSAFEALKNGIGKVGFNLLGGLIDLARNIKEHGKEWLSAGLAAAGTAAASALQWLVSQVWELIQGTEAWNTMMTSLKDAMSVIMNNVVGPLVTALQPLIDFIIQLVNIVATFLLPVFLMLGTIIVALAPIFQIITDIMTILGGILLQLMPVIMMVAMILINIITPILGIVAPLLELFATVLQILMPIIIFFVKVIDLASRPIEFLADLIGWLAGWLKALGQVIYYIVTLQWGKIKNVSSPGAFSSDAFSRPLVSVPTVPATTTPTTPTGEDVTTTPSSAATSANYQVQNLSINIVVNTDVITGEGGVPELVRMLYGEAQRQFALGVL